MANFTDLGPNSLDKIGQRTAEQQALALQREELLAKKRERQLLARKLRNERMDFTSPEADETGG